MNGHQTHENNNASTSIDIGSVLAGIWARKFWIVLTTLIAAAGSIAFVITATPEYQTSARVLVENLETDFSRTDPQRAIVNPIGQQEIKSQVEVLNSRDLAKKVITDLASEQDAAKRVNLLNLAEFDPVKRGIGPVSKFLISLGFKSDPEKQTLMQRALGEYYKKMSAYQIPDSKVIVISMTSEDPMVATLVANKLGEVFVDDTRAVQSNSTGRARKWLEQQIDLLRSKVKQSEIAAEEFRAKAGLLKGRDQNSTLSRQELSELNTQIILAEAQRSEIQARAKEIKGLLVRTGSVASSSEVLNSPLIQRLRERQITLRGNLAELSTTYLPNHPRVAAVRREIEGLNRQVRSEALKIVSGLEQQAKVALAREASLRASLNGLKARASGTNLDLVKLRAFEREAKANRTLLETFLTKYSDASTREGEVAQPGLARLFSRADIPGEPSFPKPGPTVVLATIGGLVLSTGLAFMASVMSSVSGAGSSSSSRRRSSPVQEVREAHQPTPSSTVPAAVPPVAATVTQPPPNMQAPYVSAPSAPIPPAPIPVTTPSLSQLPASINIQMATANALAVVQNSSSEFSVAMAPVTSWANSTRQTLGVKRLAVVGLPGAEIDTAAACLGLARSLASQNIRTIVVDAAMQGSQFATMTDADSMPGLADLVTGYASFMDVIVKDHHSSARIMRVGQTVAAAWPLLSGERMETVLSALDADENHDMVIVHGGALSSQLNIENGAICKCQAGLLIASGTQAALTGNALQKLTDCGMRAAQYVRVSDGGGLRQMPDNVTQLNPAVAQMQAQAQVSQQATASYHAPLFPKVAV